MSIDIVYCIHQYYNKQFEDDISLFFFQYFRTAQLFVCPACSVYLLVFYNNNNIAKRVQPNIHILAHRRRSIRLCYTYYYYSAVDSGRESPRRRRPPRDATIRYRRCGAGWRGAWCAACAGDGDQFPKVSEAPSELGPQARARTIHHPPGRRNCYYPRRTTIRQLYAYKLSGHAIHGGRISRGCRVILFERRANARWVPRSCC